jgi:hypothetical protein
VDLVKRDREKDSNKGNLDDILYQRRAWEKRQSADCLYNLLFKEYKTAAHVYIL